VTLFVEVNGIRATSARITIPPEGVWTADLSLDVDKAPSSAVTITLADLVLKGTVIASEGLAGARTLRVLGGAAGWRKIIPAKFYRHAVGVRLSTVLGDAARETGETISIATDVVIGDAFVRMAGPASRLFRHFVETWYMSTNGISIIAARPAGVVSGRVEVLSFDGASGRAVLATDTPAQLVPGRTLTTPTLAKKTLREVVHTVASELRSEVVFE